eukprot:4180906-Amphidinium_carterae.1
MASAFATEESHVLYLMGSDLCRNPGRRSIVVTRKSAERFRGAYFDRSDYSGIAVQTISLDVSATLVRDIMARGKVPGSYGPKARKLINAAVWKMQKLKAASPSATKAQP